MEVILGSLTSGNTLSLEPFFSSCAFFLHKSFLLPFKFIFLLLNEETDGYFHLHVSPTLKTIEPLLLFAKQMTTRIVSIPSCPMQSGAVLRPVVSQWYVRQKEAGPKFWEP